MTVLNTNKKCIGCIVSRLISSLFVRMARSRAIIFGNTLNQMGDNILSKLQTRSYTLLQYCIYSKIYIIFFDPSFVAVLIDYFLKVKVRALIKWQYCICDLVFNISKSGLCKIVIKKQYQNVYLVVMLLCSAKKHYHSYILDCASTDTVSMHGVDIFYYTLKGV